MGELGNETAEVSAASDVEGCAEASDIDVTEMDEDDLNADFDQVETIGDYRTVEADSSQLRETEWDEADLESGYEHSQEVEDYCAGEAEPGDNATDLNEYVPSEWESIEGEHDIETDAERVNPNYDPENDGEWENNCQSCAPTYEMRRRGYDVEAKPFTSENEYLSYRPEDAWDNPDIQNTEGNGKADIEHQMQEWGDGSRAEVVVYWQGGGGHAFSAEQVDGETVFIDSQVASSDGVPQDAGTYFDHVRDDGSTYYWRTDNAKPHPNIEDCCKEVER